MSYHRHKTGTLSIPVKVDIDNPEVTKDGIHGGRVQVTVGDHRTFSYPIGTSGGSGPKDFDIKEDLEFDIYVDTDEYDRQADDCGNSVNLLTGSVVATETAQVANIEDNSKKIASTIVNGFFKNVKSSLSTIAVEQKQILESRLAHLQMQAKELLIKQKQMDSDYRRTSARYVKMFQDLNQELETRVKRLDAPVYKATGNMSQEADRILHSDYTYVVSVVNSENTSLTAQIGAAVMKTEALQMTGQAAHFLAIYENSRQAIASTTISIDINGDEFYLPVVYVQCYNGTDNTDEEIYCDENVLPLAQIKDAVSVLFNGSKDSKDSYNKKAEVIKPYFTEELESCFNGKADEHSRRVREMMVKLLNK